MVAIFLINLVVLALVHAGPPPTPKPCEKPCPLDYTPICAGPAGTAPVPAPGPAGAAPAGGPPPSLNNSERKSFGNACVLANYNCQNNASKSTTPFIS